MSLSYKKVLARRRQAVRARLLQEGLLHSDLAEMLGVSESYVSQLLGPRPCRPITERTRLAIEVALRLPAGSLDD